MKTSKKILAKSILFGMLLSFSCIGTVQAKAWTLHCIAVPLPGSTTAEGKTANATLPPFGFAIWVGDNMPPADLFSHYYRKFEGKYYVSSFTGLLPHPAKYGEITNISSDEYGLHLVSGWNMKPQDYLKYRGGGGTMDPSQGDAKTYGWSAERVDRKEGIWEVKGYSMMSFDKNYTSPDGTEYDKDYKHFINISGTYKCKKISCTLDTEICAVS
ncbi:MAG TPA: hypothetical protein VKR58_08730 [Aquella sp.]|nr:hypothetical protein [Aquella sp.]